ncbi:hypothetical protein [Salicibibacter cibarius]|uniref:hypothetical protein n=1 Tax=Salicibibacter cibarius TaxID=2743000 RepID=UPI001FE8527F|nr:hypothetical protein [Salicibibacter cibarius]
MVLNEGNLQQLDKPEAIYQRPVNEFVANFVGDANLLAGQVKQENNDSYFVAKDVQFAVENMMAEQGLVLIRPEMIDIHPNGSIEGVVRNRVYHIRYAVKGGRHRSACGRL